MSLTKQSSLLTAAQNMTEERTLLPAFVGAAGILALSLALFWPSSKDEEKAPAAPEEAMQTATAPESRPR